MLKIVMPHRKHKRDMAVRAAHPDLENLDAVFGLFEIPAQFLDLRDRIWRPSLAYNPCDGLIAPSPNVSG